MAPNLGNNLTRLRRQFKGKKLLYWVRRLINRNFEEPIWEHPSRVALPSAYPKPLNTISSLSSSVESIPYASRLSNEISLSSSSIDFEIHAELDADDQLQVQKSRVFTLFSKLPFELQLEIWDIVAEVPHVVKLQEIPKVKNIGRRSYYYDYDVARTSPIPSILHVCHVSRQVGLSIYVQMNTLREIVNRVFIRESDTLYIASPRYSQKHGICGVPPATDRLLITTKNLIDGARIRTLVFNQIYLEAFTFYFRLFTQLTDEGSYHLEPLLSLEEVVLLYDKENPRIVGSNADTLRGALNVMNLQREQLNGERRTTPLTIMKESEFLRRFD